MCVIYSLKGHLKLTVNVQKSTNVKINFRNKQTAGYRNLKIKKKHPNEWHIFKFAHKLLKKQNFYE